MPGGQAIITARQVVCVALLAYLTGIVLLCVLPWNTLTWLEVGIVAVAIVAGIGLIALMVEAITLPGERYAYLVSGFVGLVTLLAYDLDADEATHMKLRASFLLIAGIIGAYGAYLAMEDEP